MFQQLYEWIQNISVYLLLMAAVLHAIPGKDYGKYVRFFSGLILILMIGSPVLKLTGMLDRFQTLYRGNEYEMNRRQIREAEEFYKESGLEDFLEEETDNADAESTGNDNISINVGEIEIGH